MKETIIQYIKFLSIGSVLIFLLMWALLDDPGPEKIKDGLPCDRGEFKGEQYYLVDGECISEDEAAKMISEIIESREGAMNIPHIEELSTFSKYTIKSLSGDQYVCWREGVLPTIDNLACDIK